MQIAKEFLGGSLEDTKEMYELDYGIITTTPRHPTFVHQSNQRFAPAGNVHEFFSQAFGDLAEDQKLVVVLNGCSGLTTNRYTFLPWSCTPSVAPRPDTSLPSTECGSLKGRFALRHKS